MKAEGSPEAKTLDIAALWCGTHANGASPSLPDRMFLQIKSWGVLILWKARPSPCFLPRAAKRRSSSIEVGVFVSETSSSTPSHSRMQLQATLCVNKVELPLLALVDSGADDCFLDKELAMRSGIPVETLEAPLTANAIDGRLLAQVTQRTKPVALVVSGNHREEIQFHLISAPHSPLVLGSTWLKRHNPHIDWDEGRIVSWSSFCHSTCLQSALQPVVAAVAPSSPENPDLSSIRLEYHDLGMVFSKDLALSLPPHQPYDCAIDLLPGAPLPTSRLYNLSRPEREAMERYIHDSLAAGIIRSSSSPVDAGFFFVGKKDGSLRPCIDYRGLNNITVKNKYPLPLINSAFEPLHGATIFSKLDLRNAYHLVRIREGDEWKTAFNTPLGHYEYLVMPFGLTNAPAVFQANQFVFVYLDDILIFSKTHSDHISHVRQVLQRLLENRLFVKAEKCEFHVPSVSFLGYILEGGQMRADLQRFLGFANFYRRFIRNYSKVVAPLTSLTSSSITFSWTPEADQAFSELKRLFTTAPILVQPNPSLQFIVEVDASDSGVGAVLSQRTGPDQKLHPCAFFSRRLSPAERNYDVGNRELLAVKLALEEWRHWLEGSEQPFIVWTDHKNLAYIQSAKRLTSRQARWSLFFGRFRFSITYRPGSRNIKPDALSRQFSAIDVPPGPETILPPSCVVAPISWEIESAVREAQQAQPDPGNELPNCLFVPDTVQVLQWVHASRFACHPGGKRTLSLLRRHFWWPSMEADTRDYVAACSVCARGKSSHRPSEGLLQRLPIPSRPWSHIAMDFVTGLPVSQGNSVILTIVDHFSKAVHVVALPKLPSARETADLLGQHVIRLHGIPLDIVSDRGLQFISQVWQAFCRTLGATVSLSSGFHPQTKGQTERANQDLESALRCVAATNPTSWSSHLTWVEYAHNSLTSSATGMSPFEASLGYQPALFPSQEGEIAPPPLPQGLERGLCSPPVDSGEEQAHSGQTSDPCSHLSARSESLALFQEYSP